MLKMLWWRDLRPWWCDPSLQLDGVTSLFRSLLDHPGVCIASQFCVFVVAVRSGARAVKVEQDVVGKRKMRSSCCMVSVAMSHTHMYKHRRQHIDYIYLLC